MLLVQGHMLRHEKSQLLMACVHQKSPSHLIWLLLFNIFCSWHIFASVSKLSFQYSTISSQFCTSFSFVIYLTGVEHPDKRELPIAELRAGHSCSAPAG